MKRLSFVCLVLFLFAGGSALLADQARTDYNDYYRYPFSMGAFYQGLTPFGEYGSDFNVYEVGSVFQLSVGSSLLMPFVQLGVAQYDARDYLDDGDKWDHTQAFGGVGLAFVNRFSKDFEVGLDLVAGGALALFPEIQAGRTVTLPFLYAETAGRLALDPSYSMCIEIRPKLKYQLALPPSGVENLTDFDGFSLGMGVTIHYRFGEDPDSAASLIRSLRFGEPRVGDVFAAMQSAYRNEPIGVVRVENTEESIIRNLDVSFFQPGLMDAPTPCGRIDEIAPGASVELPLYAFFNERVFQTEGVTPYTGEVIVTYEYRRRTAEQRCSVSYDLQDKTALVWDDDRKVAAFITPADSALRNYSSFIRQAVKEKAVGAFNQPLQEAVQVYNALDVLGCLYQSDPSTPFSAVQGDRQVVDSISLPRDTLKRITGDCDDLTVLYCSLLETLGIETAYITIPGHIYAAFNTKVPSSRYRSLHSSRDMTINLDGELWIPVEITLIGQSGFPEAWRKGISQWTALDERPEARGFYRTRLAQETYRPVGLKEVDLGLQYGSSSRIAQGFERDFTRIEKDVLQIYEEKVRERGRKQDFNQLGVNLSQFERYSDAQKAFERAAAMDRHYLPAQINLASLQQLLGRTGEAARGYEAALESLKIAGRSSSELAGKLMLNLARNYHELERFEEARRLYLEATELAPRFSGAYAYLSGEAEEASRASAAGVGAGPLFIEDEYYEE